MKRVADRSSTQIVVGVVAAAFLSQACGSGGPAGVGSSTPTPAPRQVAFAAPAEYPAPAGPQDIVTADFNRDGRPDVAFGSVYAGSFSVLLNDGNGAFHEINNPTSDGTNIATGDFNGDGLPDLAVMEVTELTVYLGNGDGTFRSPRSLHYTVPAGGDQPRVGDVNGDGAPDVLVSSGGGFSLFPGRGDGSLEAPAQVGSGFGTALFTLADFNADGRLDVLSVGSPTVPDAVVAVALGNGDGSFQDWRILQAGPRPSTAAVADLNGDGKLDLAFGNANGGIAAEGQVSILLGNGDGTFRPSQLYEAGSGEPVIADFNGDGIPDIAMPRALRNDIAVVTGKGDGSFAPPVFFATGARPIRAVAADFNGDGLKDIAVTRREANTVSILFGTR